VLSRRNLAVPSRRSSPNSCLINHLEPLCFLFPTPVLCFQQLAASFPKIPGVGYPERNCGTPGVGVITQWPLCSDLSDLCVALFPAFQRATPLLPITSLQPPHFHAITHSFPQRRAAIRLVIRKFRTLSIATGVCPLLSNTDLSSLAKNGKDTEITTLTTFRMNTCKSVSKKSTLTTFRMNTYAKRGEGGTAIPRPDPTHRSLPTTHFLSSLSFHIGALPQVRGT